jgi:release factor glutamine methyltransferase
MGSPARDQLALATRQLAAAGLASPRVDAELLLAHVLGVSRGQLLTIGDVSAADIARYETEIAQRRQGIPLQHLTGRAPFRHLDLEVGPGVFIPRPETELIVELAASELVAADTVVDLCAGSGAIALAVAQEYRPGRVIAVERSADAARWLRRNASARTAAGDIPIEVVQQDIADPALLPDLAGRVDVLLANPPYVPASSRSELSPEVGHDPDEAVFAGPDGLELMSVLFGVAARLLRPGGLLMVEHDDTHAPAVTGLLRASGHWTSVADHDDLAGRSRFAGAVRLSAP